MTNQTTPALSARYTILIHGGTISNAELVTEAQVCLLRQIVSTCSNKLASGAAALEVVVEAIMQMENSGLYDAGKGSYLNQAGYVENDASIMQGHTGKAGAVAVMQRLKNPIGGAQIVMERSPHVMFAGLAGEQVLVDLGAERVPDPATYFVPVDNKRPSKPATEGTVGAVALDRYGHLAAGTSTGGTHGKLPGRVSDSCIIGASTFANDRFALSATGKGEFFIRRSATHDIAMRAGLTGMSLQAATDHMIHDLLGDIDHAAGAVIAISREGEIVLASNVYGVLHAYASDKHAATAGTTVPATIHS